MEHYRKGEPLDPIEPLVLHFPNGKTIQVNAIGYSMAKPCIDIIQNSQTASGRTKTESIAFKDEHFDLLYDYRLCLKSSACPKSRQVALKVIEKWDF